MPNLPLARPQLAYIDGGLAAMLLQGAAGAVLAGLLYVKIYWNKVKGLFGKGTNDAPAGAPKDGGSGG